MPVLSIILLFVLGFAIVQLTGPKLSIFLKTGLAFPLGLGVSSWIMFGMNCLGIGFHHPWLLLAVHGLLISVFIAILYRQQLPDLKTGLFKEFRNIRLLPVNFGWIVLLAAILFIMFGVIYKAVFWPVFIYDSVTAYDLLGKVAAAEGQLDNSVFDSRNSLANVRTNYPPGFPLNLAFAYIVGFETSKIIVVLFFCSITLSFYSLIRQYTTHLATAFFTLLLILTPEFAAFSSLASNSPPATFFVSIGLISLYTGLQKKENGYLRAGVLLTGLGVWYRPEVVLFVAGGCFLLFLHGWRSREFRWPIRLAAAGLIPYLAWFLFLHYVLQENSGVEIKTSFHFDGDRLSVMGSQLFQTTFSAMFFGIALYLFSAIVVTNLIPLWRAPTHGLWLGMIFFIWFLYVLLYYQMDIEFQETWITSSYKRGLFYFVPLCLFYTCLSPPSQWLFGRILAINHDIPDQPEHASS